VRRRARPAAAACAAALALAWLAPAGPARAQAVPETAPPGPGAPGPSAGAASAPGAGEAPGPAAPGASTRDAATSVEAWLARPGRVVVERRRPLPAIALGGGARIALEAVVAFEPVREHERALGVRVRLLDGARAEEDDIAYLDPFEVDDLARTLAALPALERLERSAEGPAEIRHVSRDGFGVLVSLSSPSAAPRRALRFPGDPPHRLPLTDAALAELRRQLDAARSFLFSAPPD